MEVSWWMGVKGVMKRKQVKIDRERTPDRTGDSPP
jgi:hypothetical protein